MRIRFQIIQVLIAVFYLSAVLNGQEQQPKHSFESYISNMQSVMIDSLKGNWISDNLVHNRINYSWYPNEHFTFTAQMRNRFIYGESIKYNPGYASSLENDPGLVDLSTNLISEKSFLLNTSLDRLFLKFTRNKFVGTIGRQRINWGQNFVWNPNDIFNVQNFFDFDYVEKPGSDAIRLQYYTGSTSEAELAVKADQNKKVTSAGFYRFNKWGYDFQFLGGVFESSDYVIGTGFAGHLKSAGINGECSYFRPIENFTDTVSIWNLGIGGDYMFNNSLHLQAEGLYQHSGTKAGQADFLSWYSGNLNVKKLSLSDYSLFLSASYPFTPLFSGSLSGILFPEIKGYFAGPTFDYSISDNMGFSFIAQYFSGELPDPNTGLTKRSSLFLGFIRFKVNF